MSKIRDETIKVRQVELKHNQELVQLRKEQRIKDSQIRCLEADKRQKELILRRRQEEVSCRCSEYVLLLFEACKVIQLFRFYWFAWLRWALRDPYYQSRCLSVCLSVCRSVRCPRPFTHFQLTDLGETWQLGPTLAQTRCFEVSATGAP